MASSFPVEDCPSSAARAGSRPSPSRLPLQPITDYDPLQRSLYAYVCMADIFLSYAREDFEQARRLADVLTTFGWSVFWDREILAGAVFDDVIQQQLDNARCVICLWSIHSVSSQWVRAEAEEGANRNMLVSVLIEDVRIPIAFRRIQAAKLFDWSGSKQDEQLKDVLRAVKYVVEKPPEPGATSSPPPDSAVRAQVNDVRSSPEPQIAKISLRRRGIFIGIAMLASVLSVAGYVLLRPTTDSNISAARMLASDPYIVELSGLSQGIGTIVPKSTYAVKYLLDKKLWQASGPHRDLGYRTFQDEAAMDVCDPRRNVFCIWGAQFRFDKQGQVFFVAGGEVQPETFHAKSIGRIRLLKDYVAEGKPFAVVLDGLTDHLGNLVSGGRYQTTYLPAQLAWQGSGPVWNQGRDQTAPSAQGPNCRPSDLSFCIWGVPFRLDQTNDVFLNYDNPGKTKAGRIEW